MKNIQEESIQNSHHQDLSLVNNKNEISYKNLIEQMHVGIIQVDLNKKIKFINNTLCEITGYSKEEVLDKDLVEHFLFEKDYEFIINKFIKRQNNIDFIFDQYELDIKKKNGSAAKILISSSPMYDMQNEIIGSIVVCSDITNSKKIEEELKLSEMKFFRAFELSPYAIIFVDLENGSILDVNLGFSRIFGLIRDELIGQKMDEIPIWQNEEPKLDFKENALNKKIIYRKDVTLFNSDKEAVNCLISTEFFESNNHNYALTTIDDITNEKKIEKELLENVEQFKTIFELSPYIIILSEYSSNRILTVNKFFLDILKLDSEQVKGRRMDELVFWMDNNEYKKYLLDLTQFGQVSSMEIQLKIGGCESKFVAISSKVLMMNSRKVNLTIMHDMTDRIRIENDLIKSKVLAEESDKLKTTFLQNMSHEIRTPLNGIVGFSNLLRDETATNEERFEYTDFIISSSVRLMNIVEDILTVSKLDCGVISPLRSDFLISEVIDLIIKQNNEKASSKDLSLVANIHNKLLTLPLNFDRDSLQTLLNLIINNAIKFTDYGRIEITCSIKKAILEISIKDTGIGIKPELINKIFERFWQYEAYSLRKFGGTGLGLSIVKGYCDLLGISILVESDLGVGTNFTFGIPLNDIISKNYHSNADNLENLTKKKLEDLTIIVAEDEDTNYILLKRYFEGKCKKLIRAKTGIETLQHYNDNQVDLIMMDISMPKLSGIEATIEIRKIDKQTIIIAQTSYTNEKENALNAGCNGFITKPFDFDEITLELIKYFDMMKINEKILRDND